MTSSDYINRWEKGVLQKAVDNCHCNQYGDPTCCAAQKIFDLNQGQQCHITKSIDEQTTGTLLRLPGNNPVQPEGKTATSFTDNVQPAFIAPVFAYTGSTPTATGQIVSGPSNVAAVVAIPIISSTPTPPKPSSSSIGNGHNVAADIPTPSVSVPSSLPHISIPASSTSSHSIPPLPSSASPAAAKPDPPGTCRTAPKRRQIGLDHHRHHRRFSHLPRHELDFFHDNNY